MNYIQTPNGISLSINGKFTTIGSNDHRYNDIIKALKENRLDDIPSIIDSSLLFSDVEGVELVDGRVVIDGKNIPDVLTDRVLNFKEKGLPFEPLVKFSKKLLDNPSFNSRQMLYKFLEHNGHPITKDGNFIAYKKVRSDYTDCHTGKFDNSVGNTVSMDRDQVDDNPNNTCSSGLHVAAYNYAKGFSSGHLLEVEVDPRNVVSLPNDYNGEKMRVCEYTVKAVCESKLDVDLYEEESEELDNREIEVGDVVRVLPNSLYNGLSGKEGKVIGIKEGSIAVEFFDNVEGHDSSAICDGGKYGYCWNFWKNLGDDQINFLKLIKKGE